MKPFCEFALFVVALILGVTNGDETEDHYETICPVNLINMPEYFFYENCPRVSAAVGSVHPFPRRPTYQKIRDSCDAVAADICSLDSLKYSGGKQPQCKEDLKELLCGDNEQNLRVRHYCWYKKLLARIFVKDENWESNAGDLCYIMSNDVLCTSATTWTCELIDNRLTRAYCNKRLGDVVCKTVRDGAKKVVNPESASWWTKFKRYF